MKVPPLNDEDRLLLLGLLKFIRDAFHSKEHYFALQELVLESLDSVFLLVLEEVASMDSCATNSTHLELSTEIMSFFRWIFARMDIGLLERFGASSKCIDVLVLYTHYKFASETEVAKNHRKRIDCLMALLPFTCLPKLIQVANVESILGIITVLVQVIGYSQQNYNSTSGDGFTYKDRNVYKLAVICLRNLSRSSIVDSSNFIQWGEHWLFEGELQWVLVLLLINQVIA